MLSDRERKRKILSAFTCMWNLKQKQVNKLNRLINTENGLVVATGEVGWM